MGCPSRHSLGTAAIRQARVAVMMMFPRTSRPRGYVVLWVHAHVVQIEDGVYVARASMCLQYHEDQSLPCAISEQRLYNNARIEEAA